MRKFLSVISLFTSLSTLVCCALPALLVTLGLGAVMAGLISNVPQLIFLSENKNWFFAIAGFLLIAGGILQYNARRLVCPTDKAAGEACKTTRGWSIWIYWVSVLTYIIGVLFAYVLPVL